MSLNVAECLELAVDAQPDKTALIMDDMRLTYAELSAMAKRVANILHSKGIGRGDTVAMMLPNTPHFPIVYYGILYAGATALPLNVLYRHRELRYLLYDAGARAIFVWKDMAEEATKAVYDVPICEHTIIVESGMAPSKPEVGESFVGLMAGAGAEFDMAQTDPDETAVVLYTAAMAGYPMGAELSHFNLFQNALVCEEFSLKYYPEDVCMAVLPLFHAFGQTTMLNASFLAQSSVVLMPRFDGRRMLEAIQRERVTLLAMVPAMFHLILGFQKDGQQADLSSLRWIAAGGSKMPVKLSEDFSNRYDVPVVEGYGLSETSPIVSFNKTEENRLGSVGKPIWGSRVRIERGDGSVADPKEIGEVVVRGQNVMKGYRGKSRATAATICNGWLHTGDNGYIDEDGFIYLTGLKKEVVLRAGMNVYPREVELVIEEHPAVREAAVIGVPDEVRGEELVGLVVLGHGREASEKDLKTFCREQLAAYKCPRRFKTVPELPRDSLGHILKQDLLDAER